MIKRTLEQLAEMSGCELIQAENPKQMACGLSIDSRKIQPGNIYVPILGARADGHSFIEQVADLHASVSFWQKDHTPYPDNIPLLLCEDTVTSMQQLAKSYLSQINPYTIGITGSNGKTSTKDMMASVFSQLGKTWKTQGNHNNEIGLPLTIFEMDDDTRFAILEMGTENYGDIETLVQIAPLDAGVIVSIGSAHMENFQDKQGIARGKCEIIDGLKEGGMFIYHKPSSEIDQVLEERDLPETLQVISFGKGGDLYIEDAIGYGKNGIEFKTSGMDRKVSLGVIGDYQAENALAVIAAAKQYGCNDECIAKGLAQADMTPMRGTVFHKDQAVILDDSYKSNPESAISALETLMKIPADVHVAVLADMLDLGPEENNLHALVGEKARDLGVDVLYAYGDRSVYTVEAFGKNGKHFQSKEEMLENVFPFLEQNSAILIKGSRYFKMDEITNQLLEKETI